MTSLENSNEIIFYNSTRRKMGIEEQVHVPLLIC